MKIDIAIENGWSLKLCQTQQVDKSLLSTTSTQPTTNEGYTAQQVGCQEGQEWVERGGEWSKEDKEMWEEHQVAGKHKPPPLTIPPHPQSSLYFSTGGGAVTPQHAPPSIAAPPQPETEPQKLGFGFFGPPAAWLAFRECTTPPPPLPPTHHHHTPTQHPPSRFHAAQPKPSPCGSVSDFRPKPTPCLAFRECTTPPPPPHLPHCTTSLHCSSPPFPLVRPQLSSSGSVSDS
jgi:hypothetical protein